MKMSVLVYSTWGKKKKGTGYYFFKSPWGCNVLAKPKRPFYCKGLMYHEIQYITELWSISRKG